MATMADVARMAGVSTATVSHVINGTRTVREETRRVVQDAIESTGYSPNTLARSLATASSRSIAVVMSAITNPYFGQVLQGIETEAVRRGYTLLLAESRDDPDHELHVVRGMHERRVDGVILAPSALPRQTLDYVAAQRLPVVLADRVIDDRYDQVGPENTAPMAELVDHLAAAGHRRIGFVAGRRGLSTTEERVRGYREGLRRNGIEPDPELLVEGRSVTDTAVAATRRLLAHRPTALITANNGMTIGAMQALGEAGLSVPRDIALVGFDDFPWAEWFSPRLTVIAQPCNDIGTEATRLLLRRIADPDAAPETHRLRSRFVHRDSCGCNG
ncbi:LacI family transcriptional regulator [Saccharopolyspora erythraea NRRL 2338]|uniref:Transcriptional regulator (LacI family) n=2 Tax=Saccharopolyspora erythraea TaxID=1836 RepID=A4FMH6_SACEN|nr:LacI family DNA-binding transcriptional regulator [Saccharopolyspora erythraea]EQD83172.1 LacI family transcriptional regulator [Saccharopolyspora erythraea D]PFG98899.1 LacI family transcriptional regulator [Saccharopolyspora erythraea NRRL 2338]QRK88887.1 LacI family DNA-binding transcriptional regulator [Saccharopolyspora erythraea]CAM05251.1 transcriptional regulator (LacI family) [Saccharopolyspora erythraea NRRL 2338]